MGTRRIALILGSFVLSVTPAFAQPGEGEIEMEPDQQAPADPPPDPNQPIVKDPKVAKKWLQAAQTLTQKGDALTKQGKAADAKAQYENAVTAYQKAIEASDDITLTYQLALAEDRAGSSPDAMKRLKVVIATQGMKPDIVKKAQAKLDELSMKVGLVALTITPEGTQVSIGGKPVGEAPLAEPLVLMPGTHTVSLAAVGYQPKNIELKVEAGSESERKIVLEPVQMVTKPKDDGSEPVDDVVPLTATGPSLRNIYIGGGVTIGLAMIATVTGIMAIGSHSTYTDPSATATERADAKSGGETLALVTDLCLVGAIGAAAFTTYWYVYKYKPQADAHGERQATNRPKVDVVPWVQPDAGGLVAVGAF